MGSMDCGSWDSLTDNEAGYVAYSAPDLNLDSSGLASLAELIFGPVESDAWTRCDLQARPPY